MGWVSQNGRMYQLTGAGDFGLRGRVSRIAAVTKATVDDVGRAVDAARKGAEAWQRLRPSQRTRLMLHFASLVETTKDEFAELSTRDMGKPIRESRSRSVVRVGRSNTTEPFWRAHGEKRSAGDTDDEKKGDVVGAGDHPQGLVQEGIGEMVSAVVVATGRRRRRRPVPAGRGTARSRARSPAPAPWPPPPPWLALPTAATAVAHRSPCRPMRRAVIDL